MIIMAEQCEEGAQETKQALGIFPLPPPWHTSVFLFHLSHVMAVWVQGQDPPPQQSWFLCSVRVDPPPETQNKPFQIISQEDSPWVAGTHLCFESSVPAAGMVKERTLCPMSPSAQGDSLPCHIFLNPPCLPLRLPNPVWPVLPQTPLPLGLPSSEARVTGVSVSGGTWELSPLPWREILH